MKISLSNYLPENTAYFYCFPAGEDSNFFNGVEAWKDEIAGARPLVCAGDQIKVICFPSNVEERIWKILHDELGLSLTKKENILVLPLNIKGKKSNKERNKSIKDALRKILAPHQLIMTQPYIDPKLKNYYQISPELVNWLNDKKNMPDFINQKFLPGRYASFKDGKEFTKNEKKFPLPYVVKISSSSAGDGVMVCRSPDDLQKAQKKFRNIHGSILIEKYVDAIKNFCVHYAIPFDKKMPIEIIGESEQLTTEEGEFLGGIVDIHRKHAFIENIEKILVKNILQKIRNMGWYGPGGLDILTTEEGKFFIIDCNFRLNATSPYFYQARNGDIKKPMITFTGIFRGEEKDFKKNIVPLAKQGDSKQILNIITLMNRDGMYRFNGGMLFDDEKTKIKNAGQLLKAGIDAVVLQRL